MTVYATNIPGTISIARWANKVESLTPEAKQRLKMLDWHRRHECNISFTARRFGIKRDTLRRWQRRFKESGVLGLIERSHRPKNLRTPTTSWKTVKAVVDLRREYPVWSKYKIKALLNEKNVEISESTIGRILRRKNLIDKRISHRRKRAALRPKVRFPRGLKISCPGDLIQMDTKYIMLVGGKKLYQFTAIDVLTKTRILEVFASQSSRNGARFLEMCENSFSFPIRAVQSDNGAPFQKEFEKICKEKNTPHYFTYPRSPKQNSYVEISHGADEREFYQQGNVYSDIDVMRRKLKEWMRIWNEVRPHQALNYLTPSAYLQKWQDGRLPTKDVITLQT